VGRVGVGYGWASPEKRMVAGLGIGLGPASLSAAVLGGGTEFGPQAAKLAGSQRTVFRRLSLLLCSTCCLRDHSSAALRKSTARAIYKMGMQTLSIMNSFLIACVEARETVRDV
jgi:hypothetical protein